MRDYKEINWKKEYCDPNAGIYIRPITYDDIDNICRWRNNPAVKNHFIYRGEYTHENQVSWIKNHVEPGEVAQMIICLMDDTPIGTVYLRDISITHRKAEYGIFLGEEASRGKGYGTAAAVLMLKFGFEELMLHRIYLRALAGNARAIRSYEKAGFVREGYLKDDIFVDGEYIDIVWMAKTAPR